MSRLLAALLAAIVVHLSTAAASPAHADPGRGEDRTGMCAPFEGVAFAFCVAFCEARECDRQGPEDAGCAKLRRGFARVATDALPCHGYAVAVGSSYSGRSHAQSIAGGNLQGK